MRVLTVCTAWDSGHGGVPTVNRELSIGLAEAGHQVYAWVPTATPQHEGVNLCWPTDPPVILTGAESEGERDAKVEQMLLSPQGLPEGIDLVIGHGRFTGDIAREIRDRHYPDAKVAHVLHTSPEEGSRARSGDGVHADRKAAEELELMARSDLVVAVGPLIQDAAERLLQAERMNVPVHEMIPGITAQDPPLYRSSQRRMELLVTGRADDQLKGIGPAAEMTANLRQRGINVHLVVRGVPKDQVVKQQLELSRLTGYAALVRPYTIDARDLRRDLNGADLVLMPSLHEGFGLVASEAAGAGVPVLVDRMNSGMGMFLSDEHRVPGHLGQLSTIAASSIETRLWADRVEQIWHDLPAERQRALELREHLTHTYTWRAAGEGIVLAIENPPERVPQTESAALGVAGVGRVGQQQLRRGIRAPGGPSPRTGGGPQFPQQMQRPGQPRPGQATDRPDIG